MNKLFFPQIGTYLVITEDINDYVPFDNNRKVSWGLKMPIPGHLLTRALNTYGHQILVPLKASDWYQVGSLFAPRKSWQSWEGHCLVGLKLEFSKKDRKFIKERVWTLAREKAVEALAEAKVTGTDLSQLHFSIRSRTIEVSSKALNNKAIIVSTRAEAIHWASKLRGEAEKPAPTRWQRLET